LCTVDILNIKPKGHSSLIGPKSEQYLMNNSDELFISPLILWVRIPFRRGELDTTLCDKVCQWIVTGRGFSPGTLVSSTNKLDHHDITEILYE
jgi:hypothetical protein